MQVVLDDKEEKVYTLTAAQADEGEGTKSLKLRNVKGQGGVRFLVLLYHFWKLHTPAEAVHNY